MLKCKICGKKPNQIEEYRIAAKIEKITPDKFVEQNEGTYNPKTGLFYCTDCYCDIGMPLGTA